MRILYLDLEELLHQLGVGWEGATHPHDRKRRSLTGRSQKGPKHLQDGCNLETGGLSRDWAEVRLGLVWLVYCVLTLMTTWLQTACKQRVVKGPPPLIHSPVCSLRSNQVCFSANQLVDIFALNPRLPISKEHFRQICPAIIQQLLGNACETAEQKRRGSLPTALESKTSQFPYKP